MDHAPIKEPLILPGEAKALNPAWVMWFQQIWKWFVTKIALALSDGTNTIKVKIISIGNWNMDTTGSVNVAHGLTYANIRMVYAGIRFDDNTATFDINNGGNIQWNTTNVVLTRTGGGTFDAATFSTTPFNRGWVTIFYVD